MILIKTNRKTKKILEMNMIPSSLTQALIGNILFSNIFRATNNRESIFDLNLDCRRALGFSNDISDAKAKLQTQKLSEKLR